MRKKIVRLVLSLGGTVAIIVLMTTPISLLGGGLGVLQPIGGIFDYGRIVNQPLNQTIRLQGLTSSVEVVFDRHGIPHIYASTSQDAFMALGYLHAKERLFQMFVQNMYASGRLSEMTGPSAASLASDKYYRTIGLARSAQETLDWYVERSATDPDVAYALNIIDAEVRGVNLYIDSMTTADIPIEFKLLGITPPHWTRHDVFLWTKAMTWGLSGGIYDLLRQWVRTTLDNDTMYAELYPDVMPYNVPIIPEQTNLSIIEYPNAPGGYTPAAVPTALQSTLPEAAIPSDKLTGLLDMISMVPNLLGDLETVGSNNWVVSGSRTSTGLPLLANDPHLSLQAPSLWYEAHIVVPGELEVSGVTLPGTPGVLLGHTATAAWGFTNVGADVLDLFVEQLNPSNSSEYLYNGQYRAFDVIDEPIVVRGAGVVPFRVLSSVHGPLIDSVEYTYGGPAYVAMNWTGSGVTHEVLALAKLNRVENLQDYFDALYYWDSPPQNIVFADHDGNIAITVAGRFPVRAGYTGAYPVTATNDSVGMVGSIPYAYNPRSVNPSQGYLQSANQRPISPSSYGYALLGPFDDGYRGRRINSLLASDASVTVDDMKRFQADSLELRAAEIVPFVVAAWDAHGDGNESVQNTVDWLRDWDYVMNPDKIAPTFWMYLRSALVSEVFDEVFAKDPGLPAPRSPILERVLKENTSYYIDDHSTTDRVESLSDIVIRALHRALDDTTLGTGTSDTTQWAYGLYHRVYLYHVALGRAVYIGGGPCRGQNTLNAANGWTVRSGPSWRMVADLSDIGASYGVYPGGQSGNMFSPHWDDLFNLWYAYNEATGQYGYHQMYFYSTPDAFRTADSAHVMIERTAIFIP
ncbi:MAG: penicillin acylase family protein [Candidatus Thorarchaeota archaeon]|nr:penicillin acylase family protein [Candidatus Thorarchaeota archaeon]